MKFLTSFWKLFLCVPSEIRISRVILSCTLGAVALTGDFGIAVLRNELARSVCDNLTHGLIGFLSWFIITSGYNVKQRIIESLLCAFFASAIDVDHFISARSLHLKDAVNLPNRPFMHCTTLVIVISLFVNAVVTVFPFVCVLNVTIRRIGWLFFIASISHHIRDGSRRGLWLWPLPCWSSENTYSTPPLPKPLYLICTVALPHLFKYVIMADEEHFVLQTGNLVMV